jgi:xylose isomerase
MKTSDEEAVLIEKIAALQIKQSEELDSLKMQFHITYESFKPLNLIKSTFHDVTSSPEIKGNLLDGAVNLATGLITTNVLFKAAEKPIKSLVSTLFKFVVKKLTPKK